MTGRPRQGPNARPPAWPNARPPAWPNARLRVFAVEPDAVQVTWGRLGPGEVTVRCGPTEVEVEADGGPGAVDLIGLTPDTQYTVEIGARRLDVRTPAPPPGEELFRLATMSDLHLGLDHFGYFKTIREPGVEEPHPLRCARAALAEATAWGARHVVLKGDLTDRATHEQYDLLDKVLAEAGLPADAIPGNHEVKPYRMVDHDVAFDRLGLGVVDGLRTVDLPGVRLALVDATTDNENQGRLDHVTPHIAEALDGRPALVALHHNLLRLPFAHFWPPGVPSPEANRFLDALADATPAAVVASGHTHRHRSRRRGNLVIAETGSCKDYPGTWTGYVVYEGGIRQVVRRVARPDCIAWTERTRRAVLGVWGLWSPGTLRDRCFSLAWPTT
jgi:3',5'-cyclic-AMP phosphodiesterase